MNLMYNIFSENEIGDKTMAYVLLKARKKIYHGTSQLFNHYGKSVTDHPGIYCLVGFLIATLAFVGMHFLQVDHSLDTIWMEKNDRYIDEMNTYNEHFGALPRLGVTAFNMVNGSSIITHEGLKSMEKVIRHLYAFEKEDSVNITKVINGKTVTMRSDDFCERPMIPSIFFPTDPTDPLSYVRKGAYQSYGYVELLKCLKQEGKRVDILPDGWGVDKAPCMRISVLDCFKEGEVDYPENLKILQNVVSSVALALLSPSKASSTCLTRIQKKFEVDMTKLDVPRPGYEAAKQRFFLQEWTWKIFLSFGYHWRPSIYDFATSEELLDHVQKAVQAKESPDYDIEQCLITGVTNTLLPVSARTKPLCCPIWASTTDVGNEVFLGKTVVNETSGDWLALKSTRIPVVAQPSQAPFWIKEIKEKYGIDDPVELENMVLEWESNVISYLKTLHKEEPNTGFGPGEEYNGVKINLHTDRSTTDMSADSASPEMHLLIIGAAVVFIYSFIVMGSVSNRCINSNILTIFVGFIISGAAVLAANGVMGFLGIPSMTLTVIVQLVGFIFCIGNVYILMFTFNVKLDTDRVVEENMVATVEFAGHAIFVICATVFCGFLCGVYVPITGFRSMCIQVAATALLSFLLNIFLFIPVMVWNCKRTQDNRMDCLPIKRQSGKPPKKSFLTETKDLFKDYPTIKHSTSKQSLLNKFASTYYAPFLLNKFVRIVLIIFFVFYVGGMAYISLELTKDGLMMSDVAKPGTYQANFSELNEAEYEMFSGYIVTVSEKFKNHQQSNIDIYTNLENNSFVVAHPKARAWDWYSNSQTTVTGYNALMSGIISNITLASFSRRPSKAVLDKPLFNPGSLNNPWVYMPQLDPSSPLAPSEFDEAFRSWLYGMGALSESMVSCVKPETGILGVDCKDSSNRFIAGRSSIYMKNLNTHENIIKAIKALREAVDDVKTKGFDAFVYGFIFGFWGLYLELRRNLVLLFGCLLVGIVIPVTVLHCSLNAAFLIALCMVAGLFEIFGSFWFLGININGFSLVPVVCSVALTVQYSIFVIHSFIGLVNDRKKRAKKTLAETFPAILSTVFSLFGLILPLAFTSIPFIRSYIAFILLSISFTAFNIPLILLPCVLSLMGPRHFDNGCEEGEASESDFTDPIAPANPTRRANNDFNQYDTNTYTPMEMKTIGDDGRHYEVPQEPKLNDV